MTGAPSVVADGTTCAPPELPPPSLLRIGLRVTGASALIGVLVSALEPTWPATVENVVYSTCIGLAIFALQAVLWRMGRGARASTIKDQMLRAVLSIPLGFVVGVNVAAALRGHPVGLRAFVNIAPFAGVVTVVAALAFMYTFWSSRRLAEQSAAHADALRTLAESRLRQLQTQIEPHMLFNTLANLRSLIDVDPARAQTMVDELIVYLRATLSASRSTTATLAAEFDQLRAYLELMAIRMAHRLRYVLDLPAELRGAAVAPMLLQPLVENAIRHGLEPKVDGGSVTIAARDVGGRIEVEIRDDGVGLDALATPGYGLAHVRERLATLYGDAATLVVERGGDGGVRAVVSWPLARAQDR